MGGGGKWDVYPVRALADTNVGYRLVAQEGAIKKLRGSIQDVFWEEGQPAILLNSGSPQALEKKRSWLVAGAGASISTAEGNGACSECGMQVHQLKEENEALKAEIQSLKRLQEEHSYLTEAGKMVKRLKRILNNVEKKQDDPVIACTKVDIGGGTLIDKSVLEQLSRACDSGSGPGKFARALLRHIFTDAELHGKSLFGGKGCHRGEAVQKEALDTAHSSRTFVTAQMQSPITLV
ncbi:uncharacterized protein LOC125947255 [Dermacentor silvarum]|uniref:uncharacterized protein LOC125947255 n=1 Tax=Dermacentor silvarum TaxID=543639 RepID=UPI0021010095|nr:uncharacterized protein LOC125947255 [Dermacentor silvarum]